MPINTIKKLTKISFKINHDFLNVITMRESLQLIRIKKRIIEYQKYYFENQKLLKIQ